MQLKDTRAIVTGGVSGLGFAVARQGQVRPTQRGVVHRKTALGKLRGRLLLQLHARHRGQVRFAHAAQDAVDRRRARSPDGTAERRHRPPTGHP